MRQRHTEREYKKDTVTWMCEKNSKIENLFYANIDIKREWGRECDIPRVYASREERENEGVEETRRLVVRSRDRIRKPERRQWTSNERTEKLNKNCTQKKW